LVVFSFLCGEKRANYGLMTLYRLTTHPDQLWYSSCKRRIIRFAHAMGRIISPEHDIVVEEVTTDPPLIGLNGGPAVQPLLPFVIDRQTQTRRKRPEAFQGTITPTKEVHCEAGRGHMFTPAEKRKTYQRTLQYHVKREHYMALAPLIDLVFLNRTELPMGRWLQSQKKMKENT
jgi:hypothetical protein